MKHRNLKNNPISIIVIAGPTGSGKSELATRLLSPQKHVIINADSQQVYKDLRIGTAQPTPEQLSQIEHKLYGFLVAGGRLSAGSYIELAEEEIRKAWETRKTPVFVGGSGLYIQSLLYGLDDIPETDIAFRNRIKTEIEQKGLLCFYNKIIQEDPDYASVISPTDPVRIIRWHEIFELSGQKLGDLRKKEKQLRYEGNFLYLDIPRPILYGRINQRCKEMLQKGWIEETVRCRENGHEEWLRNIPAIGYRTILDYLDKKITLEKTVETISQETRNYAKRQETWFKRMSCMTRISPDIKEIC